MEQGGNDLFHLAWLDVQYLLKMSRLEEHSDTKIFGRERSFSASVHGSSQGPFENKTFLFHLWSMVSVYAGARSAASWKEDTSSLTEHWPSFT